MSTIRASIVFLLLFAAPAFGATGDTLKNDLLVMLGQNGVTSTNRSWTDAQLYRCLNMAQEIVAVHSGGVQDTDFVAGGNTRVAPKAGFLRLKGGAWLWRNGAAIKPVNVVPYDTLKARVSANTSQGVGANVYYVAEDAGKIAIFPTPNSADSLLISFYAYPTVLDSAIECSFDRGWERVVLLAAAAIACQQTGNQFWVQYFTSERDKQIAAMRALTTREGQIGSVP